MKRFLWQEKKMLTMYLVDFPSLVQLFRENPHNHSQMYVYNLGNSKNSQIDKSD